MVQCWNLQDYPILFTENSASEPPTSGNQSNKNQELFVLCNKTSLSAIYCTVTKNVMKPFIFENYAAKGKTSLLASYLVSTTSVQPQSAA